MPDRDGYEETASVERVFTTRATATLPPASRPPMIPEPMMTRRNAVPALRRKASVPHSSQIRTQHSPSQPWQEEDIAVTGDRPSCPAQGQHAATCAAAERPVSLDSLKAGMFCSVWKRSHAIPFGDPSLSAFRSARLGAGDGGFIQKGRVGEAARAPGGRKLPSVRASTMRIILICRHAPIC